MHMKLTGAFIKGTGFNYGQHICSHKQADSRHRAHLPQALGVLRPSSRGSCSAPRKWLARPSRSWEPCMLRCRGGGSTTSPDEKALRRHLQGSADHESRAETGRAGQG